MLFEPVYLPPFAIERFHLPLQPRKSLLALLLVIVSYMQVTGCYIYNTKGL